MKKVNVGIIGHTGRLGCPLIRILTDHPYAEVVYTQSRGVGVKGDISEIEVVFLAMPPGEGRKYTCQLSDKKIIDLSIDHRHDTRWTYGLPEAFGSEIRETSRIVNPGCYATSILLGLMPLKGKIEQVSISSTSGISGAGMGVVQSFFSGMRLVGKDNFLVYKEGRKHPQIREMKRILEMDNILFVPQRIDTADRGIVSTIFAKTGSGLENLSELYAETYKKCPFVRMVMDISTQKVIGTNYCDIKIMQFGKDIVVISALDNLLKGGAGQAVQNFNLMCGFPETTGLI